MCARNVRERSLAPSLAKSVSVKAEIGALWTTASLRVEDPQPLSVAIAVTLRVSCPALPAATASRSLAQRRLIREQPAHLLLSR